MDTNPRSSSGNDERKELNLPFGYRFGPTGIELLEYYLIPKLKGEKLPSDYVIDLDVYQYEPRQLPMNQFKHARENEAYFFTTDLKKNSQEDSLIRRTPNGYWKVYEEDIPIYRANETIGFKTKLFFHDSDGNKTDWKMIEYRCHPSHIPTSISNMTSYIACKIKQKMGEESMVEEISEEENGINGGNHMLNPM